MVRVSLLLLLLLLGFCGGTYGDIDFTCGGARLNVGPEGAVDLRARGVAERQGLAVRTVGDLVRSDAVGHLCDEEVVGWFNAFLLRPEDTVTGSGALLRGHILE